MPDVSPYIWFVLTTVVGLVGWMAREIYNVRWDYTSAHFDGHASNIDNVDTRLNTLKKDIRQLEDEMMQCIEAEREERIRAVNSVRNYADTEFVRIAEFKQLRGHIDKRFDMMSQHIGDRIADMNANIRETNQLLQQNQN